MPEHMGPGELAIHNSYVQQRKRKATTTIGGLAAGSFVLRDVRKLLDETAALRARLEDERDIPTAAHMSGAK